jgi:hypothetical protein
MGILSFPRFRGREVSVPGGAQVLTPNSTILPSDAIIPVSSGSAITLTSSPAIGAGLPGQQITLFNSGANPITIPSNGIVFLGGSTTFTLASGAIAPFVYLSDSWRQLSPRPSVEPTCRVFNSTNVTLLNLTTTIIPFDSASYDSHNFRSTTNNSQLVCKVEGVYDFAVCLSFAANATGYRAGYLYRNSSTIGSQILSANATTGTVTIISFPASIDLKVNDVITVGARHSAGIALDVLAAGVYTPSLSLSYGGQTVA